MLAGSTRREGLSVLLYGAPLGRKLGGTRASPTVPAGRSRQGRAGPRRTRRAPLGWANSKSITLHVRGPPEVNVKKYNEHVCNVYVQNCLAGVSGGGRREKEEGHGDDSYIHHTTRDKMGAGKEIGRTETGL